MLDQAFSALIFPKAMQSLKVISHISIFEASSVASSGQQGQELLFSSSPFTAATWGMPSAQATSCQWEVQNTEAVDDEDVPLLDPGIYSNQFLFEDGSNSALSSSLGRPLAKFPEHQSLPQ